MEGEATAAEERTVASGAPSRTSLDGDGDAEKKGGITNTDDAEAAKEQSDVQRAPQNTFPEGGFQGWATVAGA